MATVKLLHVTKDYDKQQILCDVNLNIEQGEFVAIIGPSGCGKSTLLRLVAGLEEISSGQIFFDEQCVNNIAPSKRDIAMVFQNYALYPHMTCFENMAYGLKIRGMTADSIKRRVLDVAEMLQISACLQRKPQALSGGQKQRVAMGRAIVRSPAVFLFDEPLSNLDTKLRNEMRYEIRKIHQNLATTSIYVTHDQTEAMTMASKVVVLNQGRIEQIGSPQELYQQPQSLFVAGFTGHYPMNLIPARLDNGSGKISSRLGFDLPVPNSFNTIVDEVIIGIRPEHLRINRDAARPAIRVKIEYIDDLGADKLIHAQSLCGTTQFAIRASADEPINDNHLDIELNIAKANLFDSKTGLRMGGWHESKQHSVAGY
ncbi:glycerol-3-phosphate ABC transporter ATP-binding protein [Legionella quinlivanii]|uniref:Glycerol-3-phosphate ABC transporter ATP-binding protein n=1 Tax=Legionella quinlivanii TaxID=45073 RepID=A0A364LMN8_9GAMM|nr:sn-glycerol-3-phosphate ABC transporter ATP-binding protein UgpC [Legionella quinlivanii]RAP38319.1 glycerol-3-phosphate ABC transporter ATP-binding protein [Legionella quinlivanii]